MNRYKEVEKRKKERKKKEKMKKDMLFGLDDFIYIDIINWIIYIF